MKALLDAHAFIWWVLDMPNLSSRCRAILLDGDNDVVLSVASSYEIAYKAGQGRLTLPDSPAEYIRGRLAANGFTSLPVELSHALRAATLPRIHGDPFDRMLVAQAQVEGIPILTADPAISRYDVETIW
ncbi:MAG: type II toxin-antitoxin system VapC family toxin [Chloroflexi bacterium]|nr:type II toxin-antitoxin system VapC family toxin [Chloroflexota bacterium]